MATFLGLETGLLITMLIAILLQKYVCVYQLTCVRGVRKCPTIVSFHFFMKNVGKIQKHLFDIQTYRGVPLRGFCLAPPGSRGTDDGRRTTDNGRTDRISLANIIFDLMGNWITRYSYPDFI